HRGPDQGLLPRGVEHRHLHHHGRRADAAAAGTVRDAQVGKPMASARNWSMPAFAALFLLALAAPLAVYPVFLMNVLCFALFSCPFNLLVGYFGLLSFGHAMFFGFAAYVCGPVVKQWGWDPFAGILGGTAVAAALGLVTGALAIRRQGIYFAMVTL